VLLRRIKHHVVNENWFAVFVDFVIVVVGVYVGIEVSNWNEERQDDARAQYYLERIRADLSDDRTEATRRQLFWNQVVRYGEAAIAHAENGTSQVYPYAAVSTTYDELKAAGELRLISEPELRTRLADYYVSATSLQAEHLFQYLPRYREYVRGVVPFGIQRYVWDECHVTRTGEQKFVDCAPPIDGQEGQELLEALAGDGEVLRGLRFWISNLIVASLVIDDNQDQIDELLDLVDMSLGGSKVARP
jgi:hypothetical protein